MAPLYVAASPLPPWPLLSPPLSSPSLNRAAPSIGCSVVSVQRFSMSCKTKKQLQVVAMAPEEEKLTRRNPLDFPIVIISSFQSLIASIPLRNCLRFVEIAHCYCACRVSIWYRNLKFQSQYLWKLYLDSEIFMICIRFLFCAFR